MKDSKVAVRYAKAVLDAAISNKSADAVEKDMRSILTTLSGSKELQDFLKNPVVDGSTKKKVLHTVFTDANAITEGLFTILLENKRIALLNEVALKYIILNETLKGEELAVVTTAVALTPELEKKVLKKINELTKNKISIKNNIDESILGGFVLRIGDLQYDASIAQTLRNLKKEFTNSL
ncbi:ATP synthase F1 subunit delta [Arenibacter sp. GZD96]|uniref:ATP synthase F1 subunit delta n=1 Tax=Aurantibrevibacter litoralis TaxID=3106030 RepID=UPI002AFF20A6|nr:ATP synthase F1 subunit delta [Arenibacter sp. GZD-96]MEA1786626.1 ATP synthase F1 subunit delta [Arenibacter sp. GZD-96]